MSKVLVIVESPNKIKKLQPYLGPGYIVKASVGHFRALTSLKDIDIENNDTDENPYDITIFGTATNKIFYVSPNGNNSDGSSWA